MEMLLFFSLLSLSWSERKQRALRSWKVEGSFIKGLFPKVLAGPAGVVVGGQNVLEQSKKRV